MMNGRGACDCVSSGTTAAPSSTTVFSEQDLDEADRTILDTEPDEDPIPNGNEFEGQKKWQNLASNILL